MDISELRGVAMAAPHTDITVELDAGDLHDELRSWLSIGAQSPAGALYAWIDHRSAKPSFEYPEITGYGLTHFAASRLKGYDLELEQRTAERAADWLIGLLARGPLAARSGWDGHAVYNFDLAMIANGLIVYGRHSGDGSLIDQGLALVRRLVEQVERCGHLPSIDEDFAGSVRTAWSTQGFAHLVKAVQCLLAGADLGVPGARAAADRVVAKGLIGQQQNGRMETSPGDPVTMLHPHLYAVEGLWIYAQACGADDVMEAARLGVRWAAEQLLPNGGLPRFAGRSGGTVGTEQCDATAQFVRAALLTGAEVELAPTVRRLSSLALPVLGLGRAMPYQPEAAEAHRNVWTSMFAAQACDLFTWENPGLFDWRLLV